MAENDEGTITPPGTNGEAGLEELIIFDWIDRLQRIFVNRGSVASIAPPASVCISVDEHIQARGSERSDDMKE